MVWWLGIACCLDSAVSCGFGVDYYAFDSSFVWVWSMFFIISLKCFLYSFGLVKVVLAGWWVANATVDLGVGGCFVWWRFGLIVYL